MKYFHIEYRMMCKALPHFASVGKINEAAIQAVRDWKYNARRSCRFNYSVRFCFNPTGIMYGCQNLSVYLTLIGQELS